MPLDYRIEVFREDVDNLTGKLLAIVLADTEALPHIDRSVIVAAALANVACHIDAVQPGAYQPECTGRLAMIADGWRRNGD